MPDKSLTFGIFAKDNGAERTFDRVGNAAERAGRKVGRAGRTSVSAGASFGRMRVGVGQAFSGLARGIPIAGAAVVGIGYLGAKLVSSAEAMEQMGRKAERVLGKSFPEIESWAKKVGTRMGLTTRELVGLTSGFADMLVPMGFARDKAAQMAQKFAGMAPVLAEWSGGQFDVQQTTEALMGALTGEYDTLQRLGIPISAAKVETEALKETGKKNAAALTEQDKAAAALKLVYEGSADAQKAYASGQGTLTAKVNEAKTRLKELRDNLIAKVTPWLTTAFTWFNDHWYDIADGILAIAEGAVSMIKPLATVTAGAMRLGAGLLYVAGGIALTRGDWATANKLWRAGSGLAKQAGDAERLGDELTNKARPAIRKVREDIANLKGKHVDVTVQTNASAVARAARAALAAIHDRTVTLYVNRAVRFTGLEGILPGGGYAFGTTSAKPGWRWVGERGRELMRFRGGEQVLDHNTSEAMAAGRGVTGIPGGSGLTVIINGALDPVAVGRQVHEVLLRHKRSRGGAALGIA